MRAGLGKAGKLDAAGELGRPVQQIERREIVDAADVIATALAAAEQMPLPAANADWLTCT